MRGAAAHLPGGYELVEVELDPGERAYMCLDDIADMYPTFSAPPARAVTNAMAVELTQDECSGMQALSRWKTSRGRKRYISATLGGAPGSERTKLLPCAASLVMGDLNAVDFATGAHVAVLERAGAIPDTSRLRHGEPAPRHGSLHALVIDDHVGLAAGRSLCLQT